MNLKNLAHDDDRFGPAKERARHPFLGREPIAGTGQTPWGVKEQLHTYTQQAGNPRRFAGVECVRGRRTGTKRRRRPLFLIAQYYIDIIHIEKMAQGGALFARKRCLSRACGLIRVHETYSSL